ncbi:MAG: DUF2169 domain-containing protein [Gammaproteobacteria bacterium]|nr:DUF2169 domain-containing protein [Gammaproteobacteria bacterium]
MAHPVIDNQTPFEYQPVFITDEDLRPAVVTLVKGTFNLLDDGRAVAAEDQTAVNLAGEPWSEAPLSSFRYEPEIALCKPATDVVLIAHAVGGEQPVTQMDVGIKVGPVQKLARVFGDRFWVYTHGRVTLSSIQPIQQIPLTWENAFGGLDTLKSTAERVVVEEHNPVGTGFGQPLQKEEDWLKLPNIEDPRNLLTEYGGRVHPTGFGFTQPNWHPRAGFAGTYDEEWDKKRKPKLPTDFDRRYFNAAPPDMIAPGFLRGDEPVVVLNASGIPRYDTRLPAVAPPVCTVMRRGREDTTVQTNLDTVIINMDERQLILIWRGYALGSPQDVTTVQARIPQ